MLEPLVRKTEDLQSIEGISEHLAALQNLLAEGRVSPRRASVIAYIDSLLLRTFVELEEQNKGKLNYYGQPVPTHDWSSFPILKSDLIAAPIPEVATDPARTAPKPPSALAEQNPATYNLSHTERRD